MERPRNGTRQPGGRIRSRCSSTRASRDETLLPIRYGRMAASAFAFFRGGAAIMAADLSGTPVGGLHARRAAMPTS